MTTKTQTHRPTREVRIESAHVEMPDHENSSVHFRVSKSGQTESVLPQVCSVQHTLSRTVTHLAQIFKTFLPLLLADCVVLTAGLLLASTLVMSITGTLAPSSHLSIAPELFVSGVVFLVLFGLLGLYPGVGINPIVELRALILGTVAAAAVLTALTVALGQWSLSLGIFIGLLTIFNLVAIPITRIAVRAVLSRSSWWGQPVLIVGSGPSSTKLLRVFSQKVSLGLRPVGIVHDEAISLDSHQMDAGFIGTLNDVPELVSRYQIFWAVIAPGGKSQQELARSIQYCSSIPNVVMIPGFEEFPSLWNQAQDFGGVLGIRYRERLLDPGAQFCKRLFDLCAVILGVTILSPFLLPLFAVTWVCMKICSPGPIFYSQDRVGKDGRPFKAWKFRTMVLNAEAALESYLQQHPEMRAEWDQTQKLRKDPRIIPGIGHFLRKTSLDELPQLWNVLRGDMSLVGPRPFMTGQTQLYGAGVHLYRKVRPGITGMWQISGRNYTTFEERAKLDAYYVRNWSFWLDLFILCRTVRTVLLREGAF
jgi:Undecaprenyl-phosphate galactose phosphotransferase WbaP